MLFVRIPFSCTSISMRDGFLNEMSVIAKIPRITTIPKSTLPIMIEAPAQATPIIPNIQYQSAVLRTMVRSGVLQRMFFEEYVGMNSSIAEEGWRGEI